VDGPWFKDGPRLPIEFARESNGNRITLVICDVEYTVRSCWAMMSLDDLGEAKRKLADREGIMFENIKHSIGFWERESGCTHGKYAPRIGNWARGRALDAVVWTNLKFGFRGMRGKMPEYSQVLQYIKTLSPEERRVAEEYVRRAPIQIDTLFRRRLQRDLGWAPVKIEAADIVRPREVVRPLLGSPASNNGCNLFSDRRE